MTLLLTHPHYLDTYMSPREDWKPVAGTHGPYQLDRITRHSFVPVDEQVALKTITDFVTNGVPGDLTSEVLDRLERTVYTPIRPMPIRYRLRDLGKDAFDEVGWLLTCFHELVLIDPGARHLDLVVATLD